MVTNIREFKNKYNDGKDLGLVQSVTDLLYPGVWKRTRAITRSSLKHFLYKQSSVKRFEIVEDDIELIRLMGVVNKMVKDDSFPYNKNRFYGKKQKYIKYILKNRPELIERIGESESFYNFVICGYSFHQFKSNYNPIQFETTQEEYTNESSTLPFKQKEYVKCMISLMLKTHEK